MNPIVKSFKFCLILCLVLLVGFGVLLLGGCGSGASTGTQQTSSQPSAPATSGASTTAPAQDIQAYKSRIEDFTASADRINSDYRGMIARHDAGQLTNEQMADQAQQNADQYQQMESDLTRLQVPPGLQAAHEMIIAAFGEWQSAYQSYRDGYRNADNNTLATASGLDGQASTEINQAIGEINQIAAQASG